MEFNKEQISDILIQAATLLDEVEALKYSIHDVNFEKKPSDSEPAIVEIIALVDHAQEEYFRPIIESMLQKHRKRSSNLRHFSQTFTYERDPEKTTEDIMNRVIKHRAALINYLERLPAIDWDRSVYIEGERRSIFDLITEMIQLDKEKLRIIADRVMAAIRR